jgi:4-diphosphocytidyl-2-C-methyl-D-erythritol kinase
MNNISVAAPAKLNLCLHITGKREDGFHLLESLVAFTRFGDTLDIHPAETLSLTIEGEFAPALREELFSNLVLKAAHALREVAQVSAGANITLHKNLPIGSGMGGGSCDAAACLRALANLWEVNLSQEAWQELALKLGSDVPMCLTGRSAFVRGVGEQVSPWNIRGTKAHVLLAHPRKPLLTAHVYRHFSGAFDAPMPAPASVHGFAELVAYLKPLHNALQPAALQVMPEIGEIIARLERTQDCALARMTGSGAGVFALYSTACAAKAATQQIQAEQPNWWCVATALEEA